MKILRIYSLENRRLDREECAEIKKLTKVDVLIHMTANNQLEGIQYPVFEFDEIEFTENEGLSIEVNREKLNDIVFNYTRVTPERNTSL